MPKININKKISIFDRKDRDLFTTLVSCLAEVVWVVHRLCMRNSSGLPILILALLPSLCCRVGLIGGRYAMRIICSSRPVRGRKLGQ